MEPVEIIYCPCILRGCFDYVILHFLLGCVGDCMITLSAVVAMLVHP